jgi:hypothetical protein
MAVNSPRPLHLHRTQIRNLGIRLRIAECGFIVTRMGISTYNNAPENRGVFEMVSKSVWNEFGMRDTAVFQTSIIRESAVLIAELLT